MHAVFHHQGPLHRYRHKYHQRNECVKNVDIKLAVLQPADGCRLRIEIFKEWDVYVLQDRLRDVARKTGRSRERTIDGWLMCLWPEETAETADQHFCKGRRSVLHAWCRSGVAAPPCIRNCLRVSLHAPHHIYRHHNRT